MDLKVYSSAELELDGTVLGCGRRGMVSAGMVAGRRIAVKLLEDVEDPLSYLHMIRASQSLQCGSYDGRPPILNLRPRRPPNWSLRAATGWPRSTGSSMWTANWASSWS